MKSIHETEEFIYVSDFEEMIMKTVWIGEPNAQSSEKERCQNKLPTINITKCLCFIIGQEQLIHT